MIAFSLRNITFVVALLIFQCYWVSLTDAQAPTSHAIQDAADKIQTLPNQLALSANRRGDNFAGIDGDHDSNFITSDTSSGTPSFSSAPLLLSSRKPFSAKHLKRIRSEAEAQLALDEAKTAEEYVTKAMQMHGARLREPIRIPAELEGDEGEEEEQRQQQQRPKGGGGDKAQRGGNDSKKKRRRPSKYPKGNKNGDNKNDSNGKSNDNNNDTIDDIDIDDNDENENDNIDYYDLTKKPIPQEMKQEQQQQKQKQQQQQQQYQYQQHQQQNRHYGQPQEQEGREQSQLKHHQQQPGYHHYHHQQKQLPQQQQQEPQDPYKYRAEEEQANPKEFVESELQKHLQAQMAEGQLLAEQQHQHQQQQQPQQQQQQQQLQLQPQQYEAQTQQPEHQIFQYHDQQQQQQQLRQESQQQQLNEPHQYFEALTERDPLPGALSAVAAAAAVAGASLPQHPAPVYEKEPVTRSYELYDSLNTKYKAPAVNFDSDLQQHQHHSHPLEEHYQSKYQYQPVYSSSGNEPATLTQSMEVHPLEEQVRVSASTEIPKAEIMKQIEKSVMRYMKELEAEGKIIATPAEYQSSQSPPPKNYYKVISLSHADGKRPSSGGRGGAVRGSGNTTKYPGSPTHLNSYGPATSHQNMNLGSTSIKEYSRGKNNGGNGSSGDGIGLVGVTRYQQSQKHPTSQKQLYQQTENGGSYQAPVLQQHALPLTQQEIPVDALTPNVEFIYKIKAHAPLQTATVKTVSKPYTLPLKSYSQFDHTAALKNIEEFDLSHVVTPQENEEDPPEAVHAPRTDKPAKLFFNSDIYHDINSLPYKPGFQKLRTHYEPVDYKGYSGNFAEPSPELSPSTNSASSSPPVGEGLEKEQREPAALNGVSSSTSSNTDEGYPLMNPYQYVLKKEPVPNQYDASDSLSSMTWEKPPRSKAHSYTAANIQKGLEYDSYSPKFNNNPEGYGYQHSYKPFTSSDRERERERERDRDHTNNYKHSGRHGNNTKRGKRGGGAPLPLKANGKKNAGRNSTVKDIEANLALRPPPKV